MPVDMKMANLMFGLQTHGALHSYLWTMFSSYALHSHPEVSRSFESIAADATRFIAVAEEHRLANPTADRLDPVDFNSVEAQPLKFLFTFRQQDLLVYMPPPPLHLMLCITKNHFHYLELLDMPLANDFLHSINVRRSERHGASDFVGNDCRKILSSIKKLRSRHRFPLRISKRHEQKELDRLSAIQLIATSMAAFDVVVSRTMGLNLHPEWAEAIETFRSAFANFTATYNKISSPASGRSLNRITPKQQCVFNETVEWITEHKSSLNRHTEQPFESLHIEYREFEKRYKIPRTGNQNMPPQRHRKKPAKNSPDEHFGRHTPSSGTRSGQTKKNRVNQKKIPSAPPLVHPLSSSVLLKKHGHYGSALSSLLTVIICLESYLCSNVNSLSWSALQRNPMPHLGHLLQMHSNLMGVKGTLWPATYVSGEAMM